MMNSLNKQNAWLRVKKLDMNATKIKRFRVKQNTTKQ